MSIHWLVGVAGDLPILQNTSLASIRLRATVAALCAQDYPALRRLTFGPEIGSELPNILVIGKLPKDRPALATTWLETAQRIKSKGRTVVLDYTDNHLEKEKSHAQDFYEKALSLADCAVCSSHHLKNSLGKYLAKPVHVIPDAIETGIFAPKKTLHRPRRALWFGHHTNLKYLIDFLAAYDSDFGLRVFVLTSEIGVSGIAKALPKFSKRIAIDPGLWSLPAMIARAKASDLCLIPSNPADPVKNGASSNRLITALALGLPTAAESVESYKEFSDYFINIRSPDFLSFVKNPLPHSDKVLVAQKTICPRFQPKAIAKEWSDFFERI